MRSSLLSIFALVALASHSPAAPAPPPPPLATTGPGNAADGIIRGPFFSGTIMGSGRKTVAANKGIVVTVGTEKRAYVCYDADTLRAALAWTGDYLEFGNTQTQIAWPPPPVAKGMVAYETPVGPGWAWDGNFTDPRKKQQGPLLKGLAHYRGLFVNGDNVVLSYTVGTGEVLEMPGFKTVAGAGLFTRSFQTKNLGAHSLMLCNAPAGTSKAAGGTAVLVIESSELKDQALGVAFLGGGTGATLEQADGRVVAKLTAQTPGTFQIAVWRGPAADAGKFKQAVQQLGAAPDLAALTKGGKALFPDEVVTQGTVGTNDGPYAVDVIAEGLPNKWNAKSFFGGFDFFSDGRAAICTFHGDVWVVSGLDDKLAKLTWRRFATGLFQPLGLKIVEDKIYVLGRDQITRLHDLNGDGEADHYENFNNDTIVTPNYHEFCLDLHTDSKGNFLFLKGSPWTPAVESPHQGTLLRVSKDGSQLDVVATGFRAPNGMTVGPNDEILTGDNQGHWIPSAKLNFVKQGGFYGMTPAAQRELTLTRKGTNIVINPSDPDARAKVKLVGWDKDAPIPTSYDQPITWVPHGVDNSSGGQVYVTSDKWGPFKGHPLFQSYGKCTLFHVMTEEVEGVMQAGLVQFPLKFNSGLMRARFNPKDGQLYQCGLKGWQTSATKDGGFYRVRYTGKPVATPHQFHIRKNGVEITFTTPLDTASAADAGNWSVEQWNLIYSGGYGSAEVSTEDPTKRGHDKVALAGVKVLPDQKTVLLEIPGLKPVNQMKVKFSIKAADGTAINQELFNTIHKVPGK